MRLVKILELTLSRKAKKSGKTLCLTFLWKSCKSSMTDEVSARERTGTFTATVACLTWARTLLTATTGDARDKEAAGGSRGALDAVVQSGAEDRQARQKSEFGGWRDFTCYSWVRTVITVCQLGGSRLAIQEAINGSSSMSLFNFQAIVKWLMRP